MMSRPCSSVFFLWLWLVSITSTLAFSAIANPQSASSASSSQPRPIPITVLSGFLGSGKTTLLQNLLKNKEGMKVAVVVNDVASVNIDSKLVNQNGAAFGDDPTGDTILELQNGCACCAQSDELLSTIGNLVTLSDMRDEGDKFRHIVVELSGVADPKQVRAKFQEASFMQMALMDRVRLDTLVTLVDASVFESRFESTATASREETPELYHHRAEEAEEPFEMEDWMKDLPPQLLEAITGRSMANQEEGGGVAELLVSQTETADVLVLNKCDLVETEDKLLELRQVVSALNPRATVLTTSFGELPVEQVLAVAKGQGASMSGDVDDHRDAVYAAQATTFDLSTEEGGGRAVGGGAATTTTEEEQQSHDGHDGAPAASAGAGDDAPGDHHPHAVVGHSEEGQDDHDHDHRDHAASSTEAGEPQHAAGDHSHGHAHAEEEEEEEEDETAGHHSHGHDHAASTTEAERDAAGVHHSHDHAQEEEGTAAGHSHGHHDHDGCDDDGDHDHDHHSGHHSHSHSHDHGGETHAGIGSFVYRARRPFHPSRLVAFLRHMPVVRGVPEADASGDDGVPLEVSDLAKSFLKDCLRSKGFVWVANSHVSATYWSHAGTSFDFSCLGQWWATLPRELWPDGVEEYVLADFDDPEHDDTTNNVGVGDRRQELVFIGNRYAQAKCQAEITGALNRCLLDDDEYEEYKELLGCEENESALGATFESSLEPKILNF